MLMSSIVLSSIVIIGNISANRNTSNTLDMYTPARVKSRRWPFRNSDPALTTTIAAIETTTAERGVSSQANNQSGY